MNQQNTRMFLDVDASSIDIKQLLQQDFLELSMKAVSSANPNRNNSWFTPESMEESIGSFVNKPILGYFEDGDFVSHNGEWSRDVETGLDYWNTLGKKGERILGIIRESDTVKIVEDTDGLSWITFTCALWTQYSFKQVKRLIKDAKRAQKTGKATKNVSVEVEILDKEDLPNGVMKINKFNLVGVTILGSRNGVPVEPGIENAELSVVDVIGKEIYSRQEESLRQAYARLDEAPAAKEKEVNQMNEEDNNVVESTVEDQTQHLEETPGQPEGDGTQNMEDVCPECGKNPCVCEKKCEAEDDEDEGEDKEDDKGEDGSEEGKKVDEACGGKTQSEGCDEKGTEGFSTEEGSSVAEGAHVINDLSWLANNSVWNIENISSALCYYENNEVDNKEYITSVLKRMLSRQTASQAELAALINKVAEGITKEDILYEEKLSKYEDVKALIDSYEASSAEVANLKTEKEDFSKKVDELETALAKYKHEDFVKQANAMIASSGVDEEARKVFEQKCAAAEITNLGDLKTQLAVYIFDHRESASNLSGEPVGFSAQASVPDTTSWRASAKDNKKVESSEDPFDRLKNYVGNDANS